MGTKGLPPLKNKPFFKIIQQPQNYYKNIPVYVVKKSKTYIKNSNIPASQYHPNYLINPTLNKSKQGYNRNNQTSSLSKESRNGFWWASR